MWKKFVGIDRELEIYLLKLKTSLRRKRKPETYAKPPDSISTLSTTFVDLSHAQTQKSSHHIIFRGDTYSHRINRPASTTQLRFGKISREFSPPDEQDRQNIFIAIKDRMNIHNHTEEVDTEYKDFIKSPLIC